MRRKAPSIFLALTGSVNAVNWRLEEWGGERERGHIVLLRLFVCLSSHCGNQFAFCRTVDKERKRLPGGLAHREQQQTQAETKPPLQITQLCGTSSSTTPAFYLINWEREQRRGGQHELMGIGWVGVWGKRKCYCCCRRSKPESF